MKARYNAINDYLKRRFGERVFKVTLASGCGCPMRDGTLGYEGCIFCNERGYDPTTGLNEPLDAFSIEEQLKRGIDYVRERHDGVNKFISYFQSGSNTYGPIDRLNRLYNDAIDHPDVVGLAISTRPDCLSSDLLDVIEECSGKTMIWVELGLQSGEDDVLAFLGRGHTVEHFLRAHEALKKRDIPAVAHVILGLPDEDPVRTARFLNEQRIWGVKIHNLHVLRDTALEGMYERGEIKLPTLEAYAGTVADFLEHLSPDILIHRVNGHSPRSITVAPEWSINKLAVLNAVEAELEKRDTGQGKLF